MTPPIIVPTGVKVQGNVKLAAVMAIADRAAPKLTEVNAASSLDLSGALAADGWSPSVNQPKGNPPRRLFTRKQFEQFGATTFSLGNLRYVVDPQAAAGSPGLKAWETLVPALTLFFIARLGVDAKVDFAIGQFVDVWPATLGDRLTIGDPTDEFAEFMVDQPLIVPADRTERVALVA